MASVNSSRALASFYDCLGNLSSTISITELTDYKEYEGDIYLYAGVMDGIGQYRLPEKEIHLQVQAIIQRLSGQLERLDESERQQLDLVSDRFLEMGYLGSKEERFLSGLLEKLKHV